eukprot:2364972-Rhodomonas_salina.1
MAVVIVAPHLDHARTSTTSTIKDTTSAKLTWCRIATTSTTSTSTIGGHSVIRGRLSYGPGAAASGTSLYCWAAAQAGKALAKDQALKLKIGDKTISIKSRARAKHNTCINTIANTSTSSSITIMIQSPDSTPELGATWYLALLVLLVAGNNVELCPMLCVLHDMCTSRKLSAGRIYCRVPYYNCTSISTQGYTWRNVIHQGGGGIQSIWVTGPCAIRPGFTITSVAGGITRAVPSHGT